MITNFNIIPNNSIVKHTLYFPSINGITLILELTIHILNTKSYYKV